MVLKGGEIMKKKWFILSISVALILFLGGMPQIFAQEATSEEFTLEEITVTAQKRAENLQKVPIAMEVISSEQISDLGKTNLDDILTNAANVVINRASDGLRVSIRGLADVNTTLNGQSVSMPMVAVNTDGVMSNRKDTGSGLFDVDRVEVLYGPQSTMYSSNSPGGIVNVVTANPKLDTYAGSGLIEIGNYNLLHMEGVMNVPLSSKLAIRTAYSTSSHDGYLSNGAGDQDTKSGRLRALYQANDKISIVITGEMSKSFDHGYGNVVPFDTQDGNWWPVADNGTATKGDKVTDPWYSDDTLGKGSAVNTKRLSGNINWDMGIGTLTVVPSYSTRTGESDVIITTGSGVTEESRRAQITREKSLEMRMASSSNFFFKWIVGATYYDSNDYQAGLDYYMDGTAVGSFSNSLMHEDLKAAFANVTYPVTDRFRVSAGYRYSWDNLYDHLYETKGSTNTPGYENKDDSNQAPDYSLGVEYDLGGNSMEYAKYATSYKMQGMAGGTPPGMTTTTPPVEKIKSFEIGSKNRLFENKLQLNASIYYTDYKNYTAFISKTAWESFGDPETSILYVGDFDFDPNSLNYGEGVMYGVELKTSYVLTSQDMLDLSVSYEKSKWTDLTFDYYYPYGPSTSVGGPDAVSTDIVDNSVLVPLDTINYNGKAMMMTPPWNINFTYSHSFNFWNGSSLKAQISERYKSSYSLTWVDSDYPMNYQEASHKTDLSGTYTHSDGKWNFSAYVKNLENYAEKTGYMAGAVNQMTVGDPRTYGAVLSVKF
jgi:iron complex outermembrane recepter protein